MRQLFRKPYIYWVVGVFLLYLTLNIIFSQFYLTIKYIPFYLEEIHWAELLLSFFLVLLIASLVAMNSVTAYLKYQERKNVKRGATLSCLATVGGMATGVCPACVTGLFPLILSTLGISFSWGILPFKGLEVQVLVAMILGISFYLLQRK